MLPREPPRRWRDAVPNLTPTRGGDAPTSSPGRGDALFLLSVCVRPLSFRRITALRTRRHIPYDLFRDVVAHRTLPKIRRVKGGAEGHEVGDEEHEGQGVHEGSD